ncbi:MAG: cation diffusion facilitator family transporter [Gammaproteobacteria bacterium]|nr:cation diffusion facilitator family transporter [Gammaproteobacteria bacterium]
MSACGCGDIEIKNRAESKVLWQLLAINAVMFLLEFVIGWLAQSTGLIADSLDMLADAGVYGIGLYAVARTLRAKTHAASISGVLQIALAVVVVIDVIRRYFLGSEPFGLLMMGVSVVALLANLGCLALLAKHRDGEVHMRASWIFSTNDVLANIGVILAGALVYVTGSRTPDLIIGFIIALVVARGGVQILREAWQSYASLGCDSDTSTGNQSL